MKINNYPEYEVLMDGVVIGARKKKLKPDLNSGSYERITLCKFGITKRVFVHRLVAEHYVPNPYDYKYVNHIDGNRRNNRANNLEWCTSSYNVIDGWKRGRIHFTKTGCRETCNDYPVREYSQVAGSAQPAKAVMI